MLKEPSSSAKFIADPGKGPNRVLLLFAEEGGTRGTPLPKQNCLDISQWNLLSLPRFVIGG